MSLVSTNIPAIRLSLDQFVNADELIIKLKARAENKIEIWEELKIVSFTRCASGVYALTLLFVYFRVQLNVLGAYMFLASKVNTVGCMLCVDLDAHSS